MTKQERKFPKTRMRRNRMQKFSRKLTSENTLSANDIIWPVFIKEGKAIKQSIDAMPDVFCFSIDSLIKELVSYLNLSLFDFLTMMGWMIPLSLIDLVKSSKLDSSKIFLGWYLFGDKSLVGK